MTSRDTLAAVMRGQEVKSGREVLHNAADVIRGMEYIGHRITIFLVSDNRKVLGMNEAREAARATIGEGSKLTAAPSEKVRELPRVLPLVKAERAKNLYLNEDDIA